MNQALKAYTRPHLKIEGGLGSGGAKGQRRGGVGEEKNIRRSKYASTKTKILI
jgi:hypothetical protein